MCKSTIGDGAEARDGGQAGATRDPRRVTLPDGHVSWLVSRYGDVRDFLADPRFSRAIASAARGFAGPVMRMSITEMDRPSHTRIRRLLSAGFAAPDVQRVRPFIERTAAALLDEMLATGPPADLIASYAAPLTFAAQCELLGVPPGQRTELGRWSKARAGEPGSNRDELPVAEARLHACVAKILAELRSHPGEGLFDELLAAEARHALPAEVELTGVAASLLLDGPFFVAMQIANAVVDLLASPDHLHALRHGSVAMARAVEELIRLNACINTSMTRVATCDLQLGGVTIRAGESVTATMPAANRDETVFGHTAATLDLQRCADARHLGFGHGMHFCLGVNLARAEVQIALSALLPHLADIRIAGTPEPFRTAAAIGLATLPITWG